MLQNSQRGVKNDDLWAETLENGQNRSFFEQLGQSIVYKNGNLWVRIQSNTKCCIGYLKTDNKFSTSQTIAIG